MPVNCLNCAMSLNVILTKCQSKCMKNGFAHEKLPEPCSIWPYSQNGSVVTLKAAFCLVAIDTFRTNNWIFNKNSFRVCIWTYLSNVSTNNDIPSALCSYCGSNMKHMKRYIFSLTSLQLIHLILRWSAWLDPPITQCSVSLALFHVRTVTVLLLWL